MNEHWIWPKDTGILDLPEDWESLAHPSMRDLERDWQKQQSLFKDSHALRTFLDQLSREWSIETGQIENLYQIERGVTKTLIEQGFEAANIPQGSTTRDPEYVRKLLIDQQRALEGLFDFIKRDQALTTSYIRQLHAVITASQESIEAFDELGNKHTVPMDHGAWKSRDNFPHRGDTIYKYCPPIHISAEMERLVEMHKRHVELQVPPEIEAAWLHHRFTQIHPFADGNGRVARLLATLVLVRSKVFPLVIPFAGKDSYLSCLESADQGHLGALVILIVLYQQQRHDSARRALLATLPKPKTVGEAIKQYHGMHAVTSSKIADTVLNLASMALEEIQKLLEETNETQSPQILDFLEKVLVDEKDVPQDIREYFHSISLAWSSTKLLSIRARMANAHSKPTLNVTAVPMDKVDNFSVCCCAWIECNKRPPFILNSMPETIDFAQPEDQAIDHLGRWTEAVLIDAYHNFVEFDL